MRNQLKRATKGNKKERKVAEFLKRNRIPFKARWRIGKYECDFVIDRVVLEVDGNVHKHTQREKDIYLFNQGYIPLHILGEIDEKELLYLINENNKGRVVKPKPQKSLSFLPKKVK